MASQLAHQFNCTLASCKFVLKNGKVVNFVAGKYYTSIESEFAELKAEVDSEHPHISYAGEVNKADMDPVAALKRKAIEEYLAEQASKVGKDMGSTVAAPIIASAMTSQESLGAKAVKVNLANRT